MTTLFLPKARTTKLCKQTSQSEPEKRDVAVKEVNDISVLIFGSSRHECKLNFVCTTVYCPE